MFGAIGYLPTYLQMAFSVNATESGLLMIPMMGALLVASVVSGQLVSRTGRYKWMPIAGGVLVAIALVLLSTLKPEAPLWEICAYLAVMGLGLGLSMQIMVLIVQNSFPLREVGTATASNNFFRQIGATLGSAVVGSLFASRLAELLDRAPAGRGNRGRRTGRLELTDSGSGQPAAGANQGRHHLLLQRRADAHLRLDGAAGAGRRRADVLRQAEAAGHRH